jgi:pimeloyl-ACP methyl ester carboxylesterase
MTLLDALVPPRARAFDLHLPSGRLSACEFGPHDGPLVLCVPGLSSNQRVYDPLGERLAGDGHRVVALDLRGRGHSEVTPPGTYGRAAHARDVLDAATALGAESFDLVGHSMGGFVAIAVASLDPGRLRRLVLIDAAGAPDRDSLPPIIGGIDRLGVVVASADRYLDGVRATGTIDPWSEVYTRLYLWELTETEGGVISRTSRDAIVEDLQAGSPAAETLWHHLTMPVLEVRATRPVVPGAGFIVPTQGYARFLDEVPQARGVEVDANHYIVTVHPDTLEAIQKFLS